MGKAFEPYPFIFTFKLPWRLSVYAFSDFSQLHDNIRDQHPTMHPLIIACARTKIRIF